MWAEGGGISRAVFTSTSRRGLFLMDPLSFFTSLIHDIENNMKVREDEDLSIRGWGNAAVSVKRRGKIYLGLLSLCSSVGTR